MKPPLLLALFIFPCALWAEPKEALQIDLKNPTFSRKKSYTEEGGIISADGFRVQAKTLSYTDDLENGIHSIEASGDLLVEYRGYFFVGEELTYDLHTKHGYLKGGKGLFGIWFAGGELIELLPNGTFIIHKAYLTTSEAEDYTWALEANQVTIDEKLILKADNIQFRAAKFPLFWLPFFSYNMNKENDPLIRYQFLWDKSLGPRASARYKVFSSEFSDVFFRADYRLGTGWGGAIETEYYSPSGRTTVITKTYGARDRSVPDQTTKGRFRIQGLLDTVSEDERTHLYATYDRVSDEKMFEGFATEDFEIDTQKRTLIALDHKEDSIMAALRIQPRINPFDTINQQLPLFTISSRPVSLGTSGILLENSMSAGLLDYTYASDLQQCVPLPNAVRIETKQSLYWPIPLSYLTITPRIGGAAIFYSNSPSDTPVGQAIFNYGFETTTRLFRSYESLTHLATPYFRFTGYSPPLAPVDCPFIFDITDGLDQLNFFRFGIRNQFYPGHKAFSSSYFLDLYTYGMIDEKTFPGLFPRFYADFTIRKATTAFLAGLAWNQAENTLDHSNFALEWTLDENFALAAEFRHRSRFDWRKSDRENFTFEFARSLDELLCSPLSDGRNTFLAKMQVRLSPGWTCQLQSHHGWGRTSEPRYNAIKLDFFAEIASHWQMRLGYEHLPNDDRFTYGLKLVK